MNVIETVDAGAGRERSIGRWAVIGRGARGLLVRAPDGSLRNAVRLRAGEAEAVLRSPVVGLAPHRHRESLVEVVPTRRGRILVTSPPMVLTLEDFLAAEHRLQLGAVVTLLAPIVSAVRDAARAGVQLAPGPSDVGLSADGRPVLLLKVATVASRSAVLVALRELLGRCGEHCPELAGALGGESVDLLDFEARLYRAAEPVGIGELIRGSRSESPTAMGAWMWRGAVRRGRKPGAAVLSRNSTASAAPLARHRRRHHLDDWRERLTVMLLQRRGPIAAAAVIVVGSVLAGALGALSPGNIERSGGAPSSPRSTTISAGTAPTAAANPASLSQLADAVPSSPEEHSAVTIPPSSALAEEAARALVVAAAGCGSASCSDVLTTVDSPLRSDSVPRLSELLPQEITVEALFADVNGGSAIATLITGPGTTAASVLIIRTEAGWLIRDIYVGVTP